MENDRPGKGSQRGRALEATKLVEEEEEKRVKNEAK
jgi:ribosomal protein L35